MKRTAGRRRRHSGQRGVCRWIILVCLLISFVYTTQAFADYYARARGMSGADLKVALHASIDGHTVLPYTQSGNDDWHDGQDIDVWEALVYTDSACPDDRPKCGLIRLLYLDEFRSIDRANRGPGGDDSWEREHVWPKSRGFPDEGDDGYTDLHHLRPADRNINSSHSNYGYDDGGSPVMDEREDGSEADSGARLDTASASFEPPDHAKGQVARMLFYMAVRYEPGDDASPENMPDLELRDENARVSEPWIGDLCTLLMWHNLHGPTDFERKRNGRVQAIQGNRNPFIDEPGWANLIWGPQCQ